MAATRTTVTYRTIGNHPSDGVWLGPYAEAGPDSYAVFALRQECCRLTRENVALRRERDAAWLVVLLGVVAFWVAFAVLAVAS